MYRTIKDEMKTDITRLRDGTNGCFQSDLQG